MTREELQHRLTAEPALLSAVYEFVVAAAESRATTAHIEAVGAAARNRPTPNKGEDWDGRSGTRETRAQGDKE